MSQVFVRVCEDRFSRLGRLKPAHTRE